jgi:hypothetical protein
MMEARGEPSPGRQDKVESAVFPTPRQFWFGLVAREILEAYHISLSGT